MRIERFDFQKDPNIGLFCFSTDKFCLSNFYLSEKKIGIMKKILKVPVVQTSLLGTPLIGIFASGNSKGIIISDYVLDEELKNLEKKIDILVLKTRHTAIGNLMIANDNGCIISKKLEKFADQIEKFLCVKVAVGKIAGMDIVGSLAICNNKGCLVHKSASKSEINLLKKILGVDVGFGTVNFGNPWVKSGLIANSNGVLVGNLSTGPELGNIAEVLGFL